jgi:hypothetical protein
MDMEHSTKDNHFIECTDEVRNRIWNSKFDIRGSLYLLWVEKEKAVQRSTEEQMEYGLRLRSDEFFKPEDVEHTHKDLLISTINPKLKPAFYSWMEKYTSNEEYAVSVGCFAMSTMIYLKGKIVKEEFHKQKKEKYGAVISSFNQLFHGTQFENVLDVILGILQVHNQGINAKTNENRTKEVDIGGANKGVQQTVHNKVSNLNTTHKEVEVANIGGEISRAKHGNAKQDKNIVITQKELDVKEGESTKTDDPKKTKMTDDKGDMETGIETNDENALEANRLMEFLRSIPEQHVRDCFQKESPSFWSKLNGLSLQDARHRRYLEKLYAKYQRWNDKDYSSTLPDFLSVPIEVLKKYFQKEMQGEDVYLKVHHIDGDGNCMYRALSESRFVIDSSEVQIIFINGAIQIRS